MDRKEVTEARRLMELFRGRFDQETAVKLIKELGGLLPAVDFILHESEETVGRFMKQSSSYLQSLRDDSQKLASLLDNEIESSVRQFVCGKCQRSWWRRVPLRKEVSRCRMCKVRYDPIPPEHESGIGAFKCICGNEFTGFACMGETVMECYKCGTMVAVDRMLPPRKDRARKSRNRHSCNGTNCYNPNHFHGHSQADIYDLEPQPYLSQGANQGLSQDSDPVLVADFASYLNASAKQNKAAGGTQPTPQDKTADDTVPTCPHPKSSKRKIRYVSKKHVSSGSTVSTFMSQQSINTELISVMSHLDSIDE